MVYFIPYKKPVILYYIKKFITRNMITYRYMEKKNKIITTVFLIAIVLSAFCLVAVDQDYLAVNLLGVDNRDIYPPIGSNNSIDLDYIVEQFPQIENEFNKIPHIKDIKYGVFQTKCSPDDIYDYYMETLEGHGFGLMKHGYTVFIYPFTYMGFQKLGTAVGILISDELPGFDTIVFYSTGSILEFNDISNYLENKAN